MPPRWWSPSISRTNRQVDPNQFVVGKTKVFLKSDAAAKLDLAREDAMRGVVIAALKAAVAAKDVNALDEALRSAAEIRLKCPEVDAAKKARVEARINSALAEVTAAVGTGDVNKVRVFSSSAEAVMHPNNTSAERGTEDTRGVRAGVPSTPEPLRVVLCNAPSSRVEHYDGGMREHHRPLRTKTIALLLPRVIPSSLAWTTAITTQQTKPNQTKPNQTKPQTRCSRRSRRRSPSACPSRGSRTRARR